MRKIDARAGILLIFCAQVGLFAHAEGPKGLARSSSKATMELRKAVAGADLVVIQDTGMLGKPQPPFEIRGPEKVKQLFDLVAIDERRSWGRCKCDGEFLFRVRRGKEELAVVGWHHHKNLRWHEGAWPWDGALTEEARLAIPAWLEKQGYPHVAKAIDEARSREIRQENEKLQFASYFPESIRGPLLESWPHRFADKARASIDMPTFITCVCRALGSGTGHGDCRQAVVTALYDATGAQFLVALQRMDKDNLGLVGAAELFFFRPSGPRDAFESLVPKNERIRSLIRLAKVMLEQGRDEHKVDLLRQLAKEPDPAVKELLLDVFRRKVGEEIRPENLAGEDPGIRAGAAVSLVLLGTHSIKGEIKSALPQVKAQPDIAAYQVCLALLGDESYLDPALFKLSSFTIGYAGLKAIDRNRSDRAIKALVKGAIHHPWGAVRAEAADTFARIVGQRMSSGEMEDWYEVKYDGGGNRPQPILTLKDCAAELLCVAVSRDGKLVAAGGHDRCARVWEASSGKLLHTLIHVSSVHHVAFHPDGEQLAAYNDEFEVVVWDLRTGKQTHRFNGLATHTGLVRFSDDGKRLLVCSGDKVSFWDLQTDQQLPAVWRVDQRITCQTISNDGKRAAIGGWDGGVEIRDLKSGERIRGWQAHKESFIGGLAFDSKNRLITGGSDGVARLWSTATGELIREFHEHKDVVTSVAVRRDGEVVASTGWDKKVILWDLATGRKIVSFKAHPEHVMGLAFLPDGKRLVTAGWDKTVRIWNVEEIVAKANKEK